MKPLAPRSAEAAVVVDTMFKLVNNPDDIGAFAPELLAELLRNAEEIATPEVRRAAHAPWREEISNPLGRLRAVFALFRAVSGRFGCFVLRLSPVVFPRSRCAKRSMRPSTRSR